MPPMYPPTRHKYWVLRDIREVIVDGESPFDYVDYLKFMRKVWGLDEFGQDRLELWQRGIRFDLLYWHNGKLIATVFIAKMTMYFADGRSFPFLKDEDWMEFDSLCLCLRDALSKPKPKPKLPFRPHDYSRGYQSSY